MSSPTLFDGLQSRPRASWASSVDPAEQERNDLNWIARLVRWYRSYHGVWAGMRYRREIDGLRAVAVIPVILFHAGVPGFSGGFVGVDVFFVISGYLITGILLDDILPTGRLSIAGFYERRARRILPALFLVMLATSAAAMAMLMVGSVVLGFVKSPSRQRRSYHNPLKQRTFSNPI